MKKPLVFIAALIILLTSLTSCTYITKFDTCHPTNYPMSKWAGENIELYIVDNAIMDNPYSIMIVDYGDKKISYNVWWHQNYLTCLSIRDTREGVYVEEEPPSYGENNYHYVSGWDIELIDETHCKLINGPEFADLELPEEVILTRVATDLTKEDFPQIDIDERYSFCPTYYYGTKWRSDDGQFQVEIKSHSATGALTVASDTEAKLWMRFLESNSSVYVLKENTGLGYLNESDITEHWRCEYFENYFVATVIRSEYYEPGQVITFNRVMPESDVIE